MTDNRFQALIQLITAKMARTPYTGSAGKNQYSIIKSIGDGSYPYFSVRSADGRVQLLAKYIFLQTYTETYKPDYSFEHVFGKINPIPQYSVTDRMINIQFVLGARNVWEAKNNLAYCEQLARGPYGVYEITGYDPTTAQIEHSYESQRRYLIDFGTLLRNQEVEIINYDFTMNIEAGVFDYGSTPVGVQGPQGGPAPGVGERSDANWNAQEGSNALIKEDSYVYHGNAGAVLPKSITVSMQMRCFHNVALGFGGSVRPPGSLGWSLDENLDWPHGTGPIAAANYCQRDAAAAPQNQVQNNGLINEDVVDED
jgi:hypothetical protein